MRLGQTGTRARDCKPANRRPLTEYTVGKFKRRRTTMWSFEHTVQTPVNREFAWQFWTDVANWAVVDASVESVQLNGPFAAGTSGTTKPRGLDLVEWYIREVQDGHRA